MTPVALSAAPLSTTEMLRSSAPSAPHTVLVLGGGALRGLAHVGVFRALEEANIRVDAIVGTSIGALVGALIARGLPARTIEQHARAVRRADVLRMNRRTAWLGGVAQPCLFHGDHYRAFIRRTLGRVERFRDLSIPLRVNALSLVTGTEYWLGSGADERVSIVDAIYASSAMPIYFPPLLRGADMLVDAGMLTCVGLGEAIRWGATRIIACDVSGTFPAPEPGWLDQGLVGIHERTVQVMANRQRQDLPRLCEVRPTLLVQPAVAFQPFDFDVTPELLDAGYTATTQALGGAAASAFHAAAPVGHT
jgi:NTE family protein